MAQQDGTPPAHFQELADATAWANLLAQSEHAPVVLFKHDPYCGISAAAHEEMDDLESPVLRVNVAHQKDLSKLIAQQTGVRHESPQVLVLHHGKPVWSAAHWSIKAAAVQKALEKQGSE